MVSHKQGHKNSSCQTRHQPIVKSSRRPDWWMHLWTACHSHLTVTVHNLLASSHRICMNCICYCSGTFQGNYWIKLVIFTSFCKKSPSWVSLLLLFYASITKWVQSICCRLHKKNNFSKWFQFKYDLLHFSRGKKGQRRRECVSAVLSPAASSLLPLGFLLCSRASSNDLPLLCRAPSAWPWAQAICRLFVPVTSAPMGIWDYFSSLFWAPECEPVYLWVLLYVGVWWVRETARWILI